MRIRKRSTAELYDAASPTSFLAITLHYAISYFREQGRAPPSRRFWWNEPAIALRTTDRLWRFLGGRESVWRRTARVRPMPTRSTGSTVSLPSSYHLYMFSERSVELFVALR